MNLLKPLRLPNGASLGLLIVRLVAGLAFMFHGYGKIQHPMDWMGPQATTPGVFQALAAISEFGGGLAWILGLLTPIATLGIACTMAVAVYTHAVKFGDPFVAQGPGQGAYEPASVYLALALCFLLAGPGRFSLDRMFFGERP
jgi:putative oxidoreductase